MYSHTKTVGDISLTYRADTADGVALLIETLSKPNENQRLCDFLENTNTKNSICNND